MISTTTDDHEHWSRRRATEEVRLSADKPIWTPKDLADYLSLSLAWVYERTRPGAVDPIPRCPGITRIRFNTRSRVFQDWLARQIGGDFVDSDRPTE